MTDKIKDVWSKWGDKITSIFKGILNGVISAVNVLIDGLNFLLTPARGIISGIANLIGKELSLSDVAIPHIPKLAKGGIVASPTLALLGERGKEAIVPLENNTE